MQHNRIKNPNWQEATSWLFTSVAEDLNSGRPSTNPASGQGPVSRKSRYLYGPEIKCSNRNIKNKSAGPGQQTTQFCFINWQFYHVRCKTIETSIFSVNGGSLPGPLIIGTFEKRAPEWDSNPGPPDCEADALTTRPAASLRRKG